MLERGGATVVSEVTICQFIVRVSVFFFISICCSWTQFVLIYLWSSVVATILPDQVPLADSAGAQAMQLEEPLMSHCKR